MIASVPTVRDIAGSYSFGPRSHTFNKILSYSNVLPSPHHRTTHQVHRRNPHKDPKLDIVTMHKYMPDLLLDGRSVTLDRLTRLQ